MITPRTRTVAVLLAALACGLTLTACAPKMVRVETGTRVVCTYGEVVSSTVRSIEVPADQASSYGVVTKVVTCSKHEKLQELYAAAQAAIASGDMKAASSKLAEVIALDPTFRRAKTQLDTVNAGKKPVPDTSSTPSSPSTSAQSPGTGVQPVTPTGDLGAWLPDSLTGYTARQPIADVYSVSREYVPVAGSADGYLVIAAEQFKDAKSAQAAITYSIARQYAQDVTKQTIDGRSVRFGSDGRQFATAAWNEGGVLIVIEEDLAGRSASAVTSHLTAVVARVLK